ncbi:MAG: LysE family translocator [Pseudomonadota bacterium]
MTLESIITLSIAVLGLAIKPGPGMMMVMSRTMGQGMKACFTFLIGFLLITFLYLVLVFAGFQMAGFDLTFILIMIKALAAVYLIYIGFKGLQNPEISYAEETPEGHSFYDNLTASMMLTLSNPLVIVFYAGILPSIIDVTDINLNDMAIIVGIVLIIEGIMPILYCAPLALYRKKIPLEFLKGMRVFSSIMIILIGLYIGYTALPAQDITSVIN